MDTQRYIDEMERRYNPDHDICTGTNCPPVHYNSWSLLQIVKKQQAEIDTLKAQVKHLLDAVPQAGKREN